MIPGKNDPRWRKLAQDPEQFKSKISALPTKMLLSGLKIKSKSRSADELIDIAYDFFVKNERVVADDIKAIFG